MGVEGGIIIPMVEEATVMPAEASGGYPRSSMAGIRILPSAEVSATEEPEIPPKIMEATILTSPSPPRIGFKSCRQKLMILLVMPPVFISSPASINRGMAIISSL